MTEHSPVIIAIDGTAASGKGTLAKRLAKYLDYAYLDTGLLYRRVALTLIRQGLPTDSREAAIAAARAVDPATLDDPELRSAEAGRGASVVAAIPEVREALEIFQRQFPETSGKPGAVVDGRDIGTVIFPDAALKFYIDADVAIRAERRFRELIEKGEDITYETVLKDMRTRDTRDSNRNFRPMKAAEDAIQIDTTYADADTVFNMAMTWIPQDKPNLVVELLRRYFKNWRKSFASLDGMAAHIVQTMPATGVNNIWNLLEHTYLPLPEKFISTELCNDEDPLNIEGGIALKLLRNALMAYCAEIALPDCQKLSDELAAHPGDPESHIVGGVFDEEINVLMAMMPCQQAALLNPELPRFWFQYARVLFAANRREEGLRHLIYAADQGHGGALAYLADFMLDGAMGLDADPETAKALYDRAVASGFWMAEEVGEQIEEISPDSLDYEWNLDLHQDIPYHNASILIQLSNGIPPTEAGLPPQHLICYVIGSLAGIRRNFVWMVDSEIIPDRQLTDKNLRFTLDVSQTIETAAANIIGEADRAAFLEGYYAGQFDDYLNLGYDDGFAFAKAEGSESGHLELYIQTVLELYFSRHEDPRPRLN